MELPTMENVHVAVNECCKIVKEIGFKGIFMLVAVSTMGEMTFAEVKKECGNEAWVPIVIYRVRHKGKIHTVLPVFKNESVCLRWCQRNLSKEWGLSGGAYLTDGDVPTIDAKGWEIKIFDWPNKVKDIVEFDVDPIDLSINPDIHAK